MDNLADILPIISKLNSVANHYGKSKPKLSSFYMSQVKNFQDHEITSENAICQYCHNIFETTNHNVRIVSRMKRSKCTYKFLNNSDQKPCGQFKTKFKNQYVKSKNKMVIFCKFCRHRSIMKCMARPQKSSIPLKKSRTQLEAKVPISSSIQMDLSQELSSIEPTLISCKNVMHIDNIHNSIHALPSRYGHKGKSNTTSHVLTNSSPLSSANKLLCLNNKLQKNKKKSIHTSLKNMLDDERERQEEPPNSLFKFLANL